MTSIGVLAFIGVCTCWYLFLRFAGWLGAHLKDRMSA